MEFSIQWLAYGAISACAEPLVHEMAESSFKCFSIFLMPVFPCMLQACREAENSHRSEVDSLQSTIDEVKNEITVSKSY